MSKDIRQDGFCHWDGDVLVLNILGTPGAKRDGIGKVKGNQLKVMVTKGAEKGKATDYMVKFLAKQFGVRVADIEVVFGQTSIHKQMRIHQPKHIPEIIRMGLHHCS